MASISNIKVGDATYSLTPESHTHTKSQISDFPSSLPANGGTANYTNYINANVIPANADLNNYTSPGFYYCAYSADVKTFTNSPIAYAFFMIVGKHAGIYQQVTEYATSNPKVYMRNYYGGTWGSWYRVYTEANKPTYSEVGAAASSHTHSQYLTSHQDISGKADKASITAGTAGHTKGLSITGSRIDIEIPIPYITVNGQGIVTDYGENMFILDNALTKESTLDATKLSGTIPSSCYTDTNTHYTSHLYVGASGGTANATSATSNPYLLCVDDSTNRNSIQLKAGSNMSISATNGVVTFSATDTNTWRGIQNNLTSTSTTDSLSAYQGYLLANGSARDSTKLPLSGGTLTGDLRIGEGLILAEKGITIAGTTYTTTIFPDNIVSYNIDADYITGNGSGITSLNASNISSGTLSSDRLPTASSTLGAVKTTSTVTSNSGYTACPIISGVPYYKDTNTTYSTATTSANGLMSSTDKSTLDTLNSNLGKCQIDSWATYNSTGVSMPSGVGSSVSSTGSLGSGAVTKNKVMVIPYACSWGYTISSFALDIDNMQVTFEVFNTNGASHTAIVRYWVIKFK
jgi:hypothetical protein